MPKKGNKALILVVKTWDSLSRKYHLLGYGQMRWLFIAKGTVLSYHFQPPFSEGKPHCHLLNCTEVWGQVAFVTGFSLGDPCLPGWLHPPMGLSHICHL